MTVKVLSDEQYQVFTSHLQNTDPRIRAIISLMLYCGLRSGEVRGLNWCDIVQNNLVLTSVFIKATNSKTGVGRHVSIPAPCAGALTEYINLSIYQNHSGNMLAPFFITKNTGVRLSRMDVWRFVDNFSEESLGEAFTPHSLRHTYATRLLRVANIRIVQMLLGHKRLSSTEIYTHPNSAECKQAVSAAFPKERYAHD